MTDKKSIVSPEKLAKLKEIISIDADANGGSASYYQLPPNSTELKHLMEHLGMGYSRANMFKALWRMGRKGGVDVEYDINKILYYAISLYESYHRGEKL